MPRAKTPVQMIDEIMDPDRPPTMTMDEVKNGARRNVFGELARSSCNPHRTVDATKAMERLASIRDRLQTLCRELDDISSERGGPRWGETMGTPYQSHDRDGVMLDITLLRGSIDNHARAERTIVLAADETSGLPLPTPIDPIERAKRDRPAYLMDDTISADHIRCLECGEKVVLLKSHLRKSHGMDWDGYLGRWDLPDFYPATPPSYSISQRDAAMRSNPASRKRWRDRNGMD